MGRSERCGLRLPLTPTLSPRRRSARRGRRCAGRGRRRGDGAVSEPLARWLRGSRRHATVAQVWARTLCGGTRVDAVCLCAAAQIGAPHGLIVAQVGGAASAQREELVRDLESARRAATERLGTTVSAMETLRLELLRKRAGLETAGGLTGDLVALNDFTAQVDAEMELRKERLR